MSRLADKVPVLESYRFTTDPGVPLTIGSAVGNSIGQGVARILLNTSQMSEFKPGEVLVAHRTGMVSINLMCTKDPDWEPIMKRSSCIVTNQGGRTCHAAIISRELGIPAVVGAHNATDVIRSGQEVTVNCAGEQGSVYDGLIPFEKETVEVVRFLLLIVAFSADS
jgi:pyruvate,water dikinase